MVARARRIQLFLTQPFTVGEGFTGIPGEYVRIEDTVRSFKELVDERRQAPYKVISRNLQYLDADQRAKLKERL